MLVEVVGIHTLAKGCLLHCLHERDPVDFFEGYSVLVVYSSKSHKLGDKLNVGCVKTTDGKYKYFERS